MLFFSGLMITVDLSEKYLHLLLKEDIKVIEYFRAQLVLFSTMCFYLGIGILGRLQQGKNIIKDLYKKKPLQYLSVNNYACLSSYFGSRLFFKRFTKFSISVSCI